MDLHREEALGKTYDLALIRRLWRYVRPYRAQFFVALLCLPVTSGFLLAQPYLLKVAVDRYMTHNDPGGIGHDGAAVWRRTDWRISLLLYSVQRHHEYGPKESGRFTA